MADLEIECSVLTPKPLLLAIRLSILIVSRWNSGLRNSLHTWSHLRTEEEFQSLDFKTQPPLPPPRQRPPLQTLSLRSLLPQLSPLPNRSYHQQVEQDHHDGLTLSRLALWQWGAGRFSWSLLEKEQQDNMSPLPARTQGTIDVCSIAIMSVAATLRSGSRNVDIWVEYMNSNSP